MVDPEGRELRVELSKIASEATEFASRLWPVIESQRSRWELYSIGLPDGSEKLVAEDIIEVLANALLGLSSLDNNVIRAHAIIASYGQQPEN